MNAIQAISTIFINDKKINSYCIALIRAINDLELSYPRLSHYRQDIAIPLHMIARYWVAYYWTFCDSEQPILQGQRKILNDQLQNDIAFRAELTRLRSLWELHVSHRKSPKDGFLVVDEMHRPKRKKTYQIELVDAYDCTIQKIVQSIWQTIQHAGPGDWGVFERPIHYQLIKDRCIALPGTALTDECLIINQKLWATFQELSLFVEALCIHEWSLFTEHNNPQKKYFRGHIYQLLTARPDNRRPLNWERNQIDILLMENLEFICPWTGKKIHQGVSYNLDHIIPIAVYPTNELWNLVPVDPYFNSNRKKDKLPSPEKLSRAHSSLVRTYENYVNHEDLSMVLQEDVGYRFLDLEFNSAQFPDLLSRAVAIFIQQIVQSRNITLF